jgi:hypothetical protein
MTVIGTCTLARTALQQKQQQGQQLLFKALAACWWYLAT